MMTNDSDSDRRFDEMESRLAFQDDAIETLNDVIARQDREIVRLTQRLAELEIRLDDLAEASVAPGEASGHEVPPHY